jgi:hypothetical protein
MAERNGATYRYPSNLSDANRNNVYIGFNSYNSESIRQFSCHLYAPPGINIVDGAGYGEFNLGVLGGSPEGQKFVTDVMQGDKDFDSEGLKSALGQAAGNKYLVATAFANNGLGGGTVDRVKDIYGYSTGQAVNPNTVLQFSNTNIRNFSFEFRMVASSKTESETIKSIIGGFREGIYPEKDESTSMIYRYPDIWSINFISANGGSTDLPNLADCYLTDVSTTYNSQGNSWHEGKSPMDVTIQLSFREFKALNKNEISRLENGQVVIKV